MSGLALLALESSCDETAASVCGLDGRILASQIASQAAIHREYGGVVPEVASRNHILHVRGLVEGVLREAGCELGEMAAFAATNGPGLVSSLLIGTSMAKALAVAEGRAVLGGESHGGAFALAVHGGSGSGAAVCWFDREWWAYDVGAGARLWGV
jgi:N6-L-threonylcarbamoyladenine synthase